MALKTLKIRSWGGLGDALLATPVFRALKKQDPARKLIVYCNKNHREIYRGNPHIDQIRLIEWARWFDPTLHRTPNTNYGVYFPGLIYKRRVSELIAARLEVELHNPQLEIHLSEEEQDQARKTLSPYKVPIAFHITSLCSPNHHWPLEHWTALIRLLPQITFLQLGNTQEKRIENTVDLRGKTTIRGAIAILKYCASFVGVDSIFAHATNAVNTPGVVLFGDSTPAGWGHPNNINIYKALPCSPCSDLVEGHPCPYNNQCMKLISPEEVAEAVIRQINSR